MPLIFPDFFSHLTDSDALRIGILNLMPEAEKYEPSIFRRLDKSTKKIIPVLIRSEVHSYKSSDHDHLEKNYSTFSDVIREGALQGLIITGAPVENIPFEEVKYWTELCDIMSYSWKNIPGTMGLCWGGLAMGKFLGIEKQNYAKKIFGVFPSKNLTQHPVTASFGDSFFCPHSRYAGFDEDNLKRQESEGIIKILAASEETGSFMFASTEKNFVAHIGHPEYDPERILFEYHRDQAAGLNSVPLYFNTEKPEYNWEKSGTEFFTNWIGTLDT